MLLGGERFSKSRGRAARPRGSDRRASASDAFRYFLLREVPFDADGSFSWERFEERYNADLANAFGNLASRVVTMVEKYSDGVVPAGPPNENDRADASDLADYIASMDGSRGYLPHEALKIVWRSVTRANEYAQTDAAVDAGQESGGSRGRSSTCWLRSCGSWRDRPCSSPRSCPQRRRSCGSHSAPRETSRRSVWTALERLDSAGWRVTKGPALFPRDQPATKAPSAS